jgi:hypothetical protein
MGGLSADLGAALTESVQVAFTQAMQVTTWVGAAVLFAGAFVTWRLLPGRSEAVNELVGH